MQLLKDQGFSDGPDWTKVSECMGGDRLSHQCEGRWKMLQRESKRLKGAWRKQEVHNIISIY